MSNTGNINYSLNKNDFHKIIISRIFLFLPFYYILTIISLLLIYNIKYKQYIFPERLPEYQLDRNPITFFKSIALSSPLNILKIVRDFKKIKGSEKEKYVGLEQYSYIIIIISYLIVYIILLEGLVRNLLCSIYVNIIQINPNNNPHNNLDCITKSNLNAGALTMRNYMSITSLSLIFVIPFITPYIIDLLGFDNFDIKKSPWISYLIFFLIFFPLIFMFITKISFFKKLQIFPEMEKFVENSDTKFIDFVKSTFNVKFYTVLIFIFIILMYAYNSLMYIDYKYDSTMKIIMYVIIAILIFLFIPLFLIFLSLSVLVTTNYKNPVKDYIDDIQKNGVSSLYELLVKYNYPCFLK
jgi:hypothetical protein